jgi:CBS-domain-containing membrane protein
MQTKDVMSTPVLTVAPATSLKDVARLLIENDISSVPVVDEAGELVGIVSESDIIPLQADDDPHRSFFPVRRPSGPIPQTAGEVMTPDVIVVPEYAEVTDIARLLVETGMKRVPVVAGHRVVGIVSRGDLLRVMVRSDHSIQRELQQRLEEEAMLVGWCRVDVVDGIATIEGVDDQSARHLAELIAASVRGLIAVEFMSEESLDQPPAAGDESPERVRRWWRDVHSLRVRRSTR